jgi:hypothetical protein
LNGYPHNPLGIWVERIRSVEAQVADLRTQLADLRNRLPSPGGGTAPGATVGVELTHRPGAFDDLRVFGSGFAPNEPIEITYSSTSTMRPGSGASGTASATADSSGRFSHVLGVSCPAGDQTTHSAFARGVSSGRISNKAGASC